jgi:predicted Zn-dependent protease with MMP-like domain
VEELLRDICDEIPQVFFEKLNGGVVLLTQTKLHPKGGGLLVMGEYEHRHDMGRTIYIYFGSFMRLYGYVEETALRRELRKTLLHEFTHHVESLAGERGLEEKDAQQIREYLRSTNANRGE